MPRCSIINLEFSLGGVVIGLLLCSDDRIRELNRQFCGNDKATNILSFSQLDEDLFVDGVLSAEELAGQQLGEIAIAETVVAQTN